jgi:hypothetical protein
MSLLHVLPGYSAYVMAREPNLRNLVNATLPSIMAGYALRASVVWFEAENVRRYGTGARYGWRQMAAMKAHEMQTVASRSRALGPTAALLTAEAYMAHELYGGMTKNLEMESVEHVPGAMTHPFEGGSDDVYYPGKSLVDWVASLW